MLCQIYDAHTWYNSPLHTEVNHPSYCKTKGRTVSFQLRSNLRQMKHYNYWTSALRIPSVPSLRKFCPTRFHRHPPALVLATPSPFQRKILLDRSDRSATRSLGEKRLRGKISFKNWTNAGIAEGITGLWLEVVEGVKDEENEKKRSEVKNQSGSRSFVFRETSVTSRSWISIQFGDSLFARSLVQLLSAFWRRRCDGSRFSFTLRWFVLHRDSCGKLSSTSVCQVGRAANFVVYLFASTSGTKRVSVENCEDVRRKNSHKPTPFLKSHFHFFFRVRAAENFVVLDEN